VQNQVKMGHDFVLYNAELDENGTGLRQAFLAIFEQYEVFK